jgi:GT2 family glycosyltransferase
MAYHPVQFEDTDYCYRIREKGYRCVYHPGVQVYHFENVTTGGTKKLNYTYLTVKNGKVFKDRWAHMYSKEDGPDERSMVWKDITSVSISEIGELEVVE